jgi:hypothetical protein
MNGGQGLANRLDVRFPPISTPGTLQTELPLACAPTRTTTPPSGVSVRNESGRTRCNCGAIRFRQLTESASLFESVSTWMKGGWKETQGVQRPISATSPVSESRMALLNPFETKRKKVPSGTSSRVCDVQVAGQTRFELAGRVEKEPQSVHTERRTKVQGPRPSNQLP